MGRGDMPDFNSFPKSQQVTFKYYEGVLAFLEENYAAVRRKSRDITRSALPMVDCLY
jgi:hypothetical protein